MLYKCLPSTVRWSNLELKESLDGGGVILTVGCIHNVPTLSLKLTGHWPWVNLLHPSSGIILVWHIEGETTDEFECSNLLELQTESEHFWPILHRSRPRFTHLTLNQISMFPHGWSTIFVAICGYFIRLFYLLRFGEAASGAVVQTNWTNLRKASSMVGMEKLQNS